MTDDVTDDVTDLVEQAYAPLRELGRGLDDITGWRATELPGWSVRDLLFHLTDDCHRALTAFGTPAPDGAAADTDEVSYWTGWRPGTDGAQSNLRGTRMIASAFARAATIGERYDEAAAAVVTLARTQDLGRVVVTQGHRIAVRGLLSTLVVEAAIHHLDLGPVLADPPAPAVRAELRRVLDGLLGEAAPSEWDDLRYARLATGRAAPDQAERDRLGARVERLPLFG